MCPVGTPTALTSACGPVRLGLGGSAASAASTGRASGVMEPPDRIRASSSARRRASTGLSANAFRRESNSSSPSVDVTLFITSNTAAERMLPTTRSAPCVPSAAAAVTLTLPPARSPGVTVWRHSMEKPFSPPMSGRCTSVVPEPISIPSRRTDTCSGSELWLLRAQPRKTPGAWNCSTAPQTRPPCAGWVGVWAAVAGAAVATAGDERGAWVAAGAEAATPGGGAGNGAIGVAWARRHRCRRWRAPAAVRLKTMPSTAAELRTGPCPGRSFRRTGRRWRDT